MIIQTCASMCGGEKKKTNKQRKTIESSLNPVCKIIQWFFLFIFFSSLIWVKRVMTNNFFI